MGKNLWIVTTLLLSPGIDFLLILPKWQHAATKSQLLGTSKTILCFKEEKGLCFGITEKI